MPDNYSGPDEMQQLRELLLGPLLAQNKIRDQKIMEFVEQFSTELAARLSDTERRLSELAAEIDNRDSVVSDIGDGIANLGHQLRSLASKAETGQFQQQAPEPAKSAKK